MSLKDDLSALKDEANSKSDREQRIRELPFKIIGEEMTVSSVRNSLLSEAIQLITPKNWRCAKKVFTQEDYLDYLPKGPSESIIKVQYDGRCYLAEIRDGEIVEVKDGPFFQARCRAAREKRANIRNNYAAASQAYLLGEQHYVRFECRSGPDYSTPYLYLFKDGALLGTNNFMEEAHYDWRRDVWEDDEGFRRWLLKELMPLSG